MVCKTCWVMWQSWKKWASARSFSIILWKRVCQDPVKAVFLCPPLLPLLFPQGKPISYTSAKELQDLSMVAPWSLQDEAKRDFSPDRPSGAALLLILHPLNLCLSSLTQLREQGWKIFWGMRVRGRWENSKLHHSTVHKHYSSRRMWFLPWWKFFCVVVRSLLLCSVVPEHLFQSPVLSLYADNYKLRQHLYTAFF